MPLGAFSRRRTGEPLDLSAEATTPTSEASAAAPGSDEPTGVADDEGGPGGGHEAGTVVLAIGSPYFHDGTVGGGRYESDLPPTLLAAVHSIQELARAVLAEAGALDQGELVVRSESWALHLGPEPGYAKLVRLDGEVAGSRSGAHTDRRAHQWLRGIAALRQSDHAQAQAAFEAEAKEAVEAGLPQRAAVAYRAAAASARSVGRSDQANRMLRLAGKYYLEIAEGAETLPQGVFSAYREAARAFLEAGNLPLAHQSLTKAIAVGEALGLAERS